jgi:hypothetical protein
MRYNTDNKLRYYNPVNNPDNDTRYTNTQHGTDYGLRITDYGSQRENYYENQYGNQLPNVPPIPSPSLVDASPSQLSPPFLKRYSANVVQSLSPYAKCVDNTDMGISTNLGFVPTGLRYGRYHGYNYIRDDEWRYDHDDHGRYNANRGREQYPDVADVADSVPTGADRGGKAYLNVVDGVHHHDENGSYGGRYDHSDVIRVSVRAGSGLGLGGWDLI